MLEKINQVLNQIMEDERSKGGSGREIVSRWLQRARLYDIEVREMLDNRTHRKLRVRLSRADAVLHSRSRLSRFLVGADHWDELDAQGWNRIRRIDRTIPLEQRGHRGHGINFAPRRDQRALVDGAPQAYSALRHFCSLRGMGEMEARKFFEDLAGHYHLSVRRLSPVKSHLKPVMYGVPQKVLLKTHKGKREVRFGGVWPIRISKSDQLEDRVMTVVFAHSGRKQVFEAQVPLMADPLNVDMTPKQVPVSAPDPECSPRLLGTLAPALGTTPEVLEQRLAEVAPSWWFSRNFGKCCERRWRHGRMQANTWSRDRGDWIFTNGVWVEYIDPQTLEVTIALERTMGRVKRFTLSLGEFIREVRLGTLTDLERRDARTFVLHDESGQVAWHIISNDCPEDLRLAGGKTFVDAAVAKKALASAA